MCTCCSDFNLRTWLIFKFLHFALVFAHDLPRSISTSCTTLDELRVKASNMVSIRSACTAWTENASNEFHELLPWMKGALFQSLESIMCERVAEGHKRTLQH